MRGGGLRRVLPECEISIDKVDGKIVGDPSQVVAFANAHDPVEQCGTPPWQKVVAILKQPRAARMRAGLLLVDHVLPHLLALGEGKQGQRNRAEVRTQ